MKAQAITFSLAVMGAVALFMPRQHGAAEATAARTLAAATPDDEGGGTRNGNGRITLSRGADGHFYAPVRIAGRRVTMLVDTGASFVALTRADADAAGVDWRMDDAVVVGTGASGPVRGVPVTLDEMEVGDHRARHVRAAVIVDGLGVSLLGQSYLQQVDTVRIEGDRMVLGAD